MISFFLLLCLLNLSILMEIHSHKGDYPDLHVYKFASPFYSKCIAFTTTMPFANVLFSLRNYWHVNEYKIPSKLNFNVIKSMSG